MFENSLSLLGSKASQLHTLLRTARRVHTCVHVHVQMHCVVQRWDALKYIYQKVQDIMTVMLIACVARRQILFSQPRISTCTYTCYYCCVRVWLFTSTFFSQQNSFSDCALYHCHGHLHEHIHLHVKDVSLHLKFFFFTSVFEMYDVFPDLKSLHVGGLTCPAGFMKLHNVGLLAFWHTPYCESMLVMRLVKPLHVSTLDLR